MHGFPESNFDLVFEAGAGFRARRRLGRRATAAEILAEQIAEARAATASASAKIESAEIEMHVVAARAPWHSTRARSFKTILIVHLAFLGVGQDVVGFLHLFELFFRGFIARIKVRMIFPGKLAVGLPDFLLRRLAGDAQEFVVILFSCSGHVW